MSIDLFLEVAHFIDDLPRPIECRHDACEGGLDVAEVVDEAAVRVGFVGGDCFGVFREGGNVVSEVVEDEGAEGFSGEFVGVGQVCQCAG